VKKARKFRAASAVARKDTPAALPAPRTSLDDDDDMDTASVATKVRCAARHHRIVCNVDVCARCDAVCVRRRCLQHTAGTTGTRGTKATKGAKAKKNKKQSVRFDAMMTKLGAVRTLEREMAAAAAARKNPLGSLSQLQSTLGGDAGGDDLAAALGSIAAPCGAGECW
jgi:hypothetical protein